MKENISNHSIDPDIVFLSLDAMEFNAISWTEENEFSKDGILYDVISIDKKENGRYILKVVDDKREKRVLNALFTDSGQGTATKKCAHLFFQFFSQFVPQHEVFNPCHPSRAIENDFIYMNHYSFLYSAQISLPPQKL